MLETPSSLPRSWKEEGEEEEEGEDEKMKRLKKKGKNITDVPGRKKVEGEIFYRISMGQFLCHQYSPTFVGPQ